jgi:predicted transcriptional regulator
MLAVSLINDSLQALRRTDTVATARGFLAEQGVTELPILDNKSLYNYVRAVLLLDVDGTKKLDEVIAFNPLAPHIKENQHVYEIVPAFAASDLHTMAVMNEHSEFIGIVDDKNIHKVISQSLTYRGIGAILVLQVEPKDFAPSHIARLVEENGARILGMMVNNTEAGNMEVNLKLNTTLVNGIAASLDRFGYKVIDCFMSEDYNKENHREFESVLKFFDI